MNCFAPIQLVKDDLNERERSGQRSGSTVRQAKPLSVHDSKTWRFRARCWNAFVKGNSRSEDAVGSCGTSACRSSVIHQGTRAQPRRASVDDMAFVEMQMHYRAP